eukprot:scaffold1518_cov417-Prasinococcus_capsulatus_cf.AAC.23
MPGRPPMSAVTRPMKKVAYNPTSGSTPATKLNATDSGIWAMATIEEDALPPRGHQVKHGPPPCLSIHTRNSQGRTAFQYRGPEKTVSEKPSLACQLVDQHVGFLLLSLSRTWMTAVGLVGSFVACSRSNAESSLVSLVGTSRVPRLAQACLASEGQAGPVRRRCGATRGGAVASGRRLLRCRRSSCAHAKATGGCLMGRLRHAIARSGLSKQEGWAACKVIARGEARLTRNVPGQWEYATGGRGGLEPEESSYHEGPGGVSPRTHAGESPCLPVRWKLGGVKSK